jgi:8-oxo-dGTP pyrophosphatase MutT (NUDIX family)
MPVSIDHIASRLSEHEPTRYPVGENTRRAAVAAILKPEAGHTQALFILRAPKEGDPWSGQMAFPGGHIETFDDSSTAAAIRETREEIGLDLEAHGRYLGPLDEVKANPRGRKIDMVVSPHVFLLENPNVTFTPNYEVADVLWGSLHDMYHGRVETETQFAMNEVVQSFPGYAVGDQVVWGLTMRMLDHVFSLVDPDWQGRAY